MPALNFSLAREGFDPQASDPSASGRLFGFSWSRVMVFPEPLRPWLGAKAIAKRFG